MSGNGNKKNKRDYLGIHRIDARQIREVIPVGSVDVTITSPPYFDLKDYGNKKQIGFGQDYKTYLGDLGLVFDGVYKCTKSTGSLWVIIDSYRRDGEVVPLPFDFSRAVKKSGWKLKDVIVWEKDRTVPWAHKGQMRNLFEYILVFSKSSDFLFDLDKVRSHESIERWWVKYPERYNPNGKAPDGIWKFDIPVQGSWGNGFLRHFCPLPEALVGQILEITTKEGDVVLDPFAGSGAVLAKAHYMNRNYVGLELNSKYIRMFRDYLGKTASEKSTQYIRERNLALSKDEFYRLIIDLRCLKYAKILAAKIYAGRVAKLSKIYVERLARSAKGRNAIVSSKYIILVENPKAVGRLRSFVRKICSIPPLSKFGIEPVIEIESSTKRFERHISTEFIYTYSRHAPYKWKERQRKAQAIEQSDDLIISRIKVRADESILR